MTVDTRPTPTSIATSDSTDGGTRRLRALTRRLPHRRADDRGQATAEYGLVILVAGGIALGVIAWAGGTGAFTDLFETVIDNLSSGL
jgi:hypothetical protein